MSEQEGYTYPGIHALRNKVDIRDLVVLQRSKRGTTAVRIQELRENPTRGKYDLAHPRTIHKQVFRDICGWVGEMRKADTAEGPADDRTLSTFREDTPQKAREIQSVVKEINYPRGMDEEQFSGEMAEVYVGVNEIHSFREGNGHATRELIGRLTKDVGYQLDYFEVDKRM